MEKLSEWEDHPSFGIIGGGIPVSPLTVNGGDNLTTTTRERGTATMFRSTRDATNGCTNGRNNDDGNE